VIDLERKTRERLTNDPVGAQFPVWSSDGTRVIYASAREGSWNLFARTVARPEEQPLYRALSPQLKYPSEVTPDGRYVLFHGEGVWMLPMSGDPRPVRLISGTQGHVSPDGRWLAFAAASQTGPRQVYVTSFPHSQDRWLVSRSGGEDPHWASNGRELFFLDANQTLTAATVSAVGGFQVTNLQPLFRVSPSLRSVDGAGTSYAPAADGESFLINERVQDEELTLTVVENWSPDRR
jgi:Tol biopolymer transport system component